MRRVKGALTDLMKDLNIDDTGTLTFHLKKLVGFIAKTPDGYYELTELGLKAFSLLKAPQQLSAKPSSAEGISTVKHVRGVSAEEVKPDLVVLRDRISLTIDRELLERVRAMGKRLLIKNVINVSVAEDVDPNLFDEAIESIQNVMTLRVPKHLETLVHLKVSDVLSIASSKGATHTPPLVSMVSDAVEAIASVVTRMVSSLAPRMLAMRDLNRELVFSRAIPNVKVLTLEVDGGYAKISFKAM